MYFHEKMMKKLGVEVDVKIVMNVLFSRSFHLSTVVGGLNISPQTGIKLTQTEEIIIFNSIFRPLPKLKMVFQNHILKALFTEMLIIV